MSRGFSGRNPVLALLIPIALSACGPSETESLHRARRAELERRNQGLRELIAEAERGSLLPRDRFMVGVDEALAREIFASRLPLERVVGGVARLHLESVTFRFHEKYGTVRIEGGIRPRGLPLRPVALRNQGGLGSAEIDPGSGILRLRIAVDHVTLVEASGLEGLLGRGALGALGSEARDLLAEALPPLEIPVRVERAVPVPALEEGGVRLSALEVPLAVAVERVLAAGGKLWVMFDAAVGPVRGGDGHLDVEIDRRRPKGPS
jgi:hypothetical protein